MIKTKKDNEEFWLVVEDCLVTFHRRARARAKEAVSGFRGSICGRLKKDEFDLIYHVEPFSVACEIAAAELDISERRSQYEEILQKRGC